MPAAIGAARVKIVHLARVQAAADDHGEKVPSWPDPTPGTNEYWAALEQVSGGEELAASLRQTAGTVTLKVRGRPAIVQADRVKLKDDGTVYGVDRVFVLPGTAETVLTCSLP